MNLIHDGLYQDEASLLTKTKRVVKTGIKRTAYTAFIGISIVTALHLYNNDKDRETTISNFKGLGLAMKTQINNYFFKQTGHTLSEDMQKAGKFIADHTHSTVEDIKSIIPTKHDGEKFVAGTQKASTMITNDVQKETPGLIQTIKEDAKGSAVKAKTQITQHIKEMRDYGNDLTQKSSNSNKP